MVRPDARRAVVRWAEEAYRVSERRACRAIGVSRSVVRYRSVRPHQAVLRERVKELAAVRVRSGLPGYYHPADALDLISSRRYATGHMVDLYFWTHYPSPLPLKRFINGLTHYSITISHHAVKKDGD
jgi:hypothetical protein